MAVSTRAKVSLTVIGIPLALVAAFSWVTWRRYEQSKMDAPLIKAVRAADISELKRLLDAGADPNARDKPYRHMSLWEMARSMLRRSADDRGETYLSALMAAAATDSAPEVPKLLLDRGAQVNARGPGGTSALLETAGASGKASVRLLLDRGADIRASNDQKKDALLIAVESKREENALVLMQRGATAKAKETDGHTAMAWAIENGLSGLFVPLIKAGAIPDEHDANDKTALSSVISGGKPEEVKAVLSAGANPNVRADGQLPLAYAYQLIESRWASDDGEVKPAGRRRAFQILLDYKADPNTKDSDEVPVLFRAMRDGEVELTRALLQAGANPNLREKDQPALLEAVTLRDPEVVRLLLERGADLKSVDSSGTTALMVSAFNGDALIAKLLLDHGADPAIGDRAGVTAAEYARDSPAIAAMIRSSLETTSKASASKALSR